MSFSMNNKYTIVQIRPDTIIPFNDLTDKSQNKTFPESMLLMPLVVCSSPENDSQYIIIDGYKRFVALLEKQPDTITCMVFDTNSMIHAGKMRIELNNSRPISFKEKFFFLKWAKLNGDESDYLAISQQLSVFGKDLRDFEELFDASEILIDAVLKGFLDSTIVSELKFFSEEDTNAVLQLFTRFPFTRQMQRELLEWLPELVYRSKKSIIELIELEYVKKTIEDRKLNDPQKIKKIRDHYYELRFPTLIRAKKAWNTLASTLNPAPSNVIFSPSEAFEKNMLEVKIRITEAQQGIDTLKKLSEISTEDWESLIYPALLFNAKPEK
jgi:hypothetical protein